MDSYMSGVAMVFTCTVVAVCGLFFVRRKIQPETLKACHEVGGYLLAVTGTLYAVLLGLIVVDAMSVFQEAHKTTVQEANALTDVMLLARRLPEAPRQRILHLATSYVDLVVGKEWDEMGRGRDLPEAQPTALDLFDTVLVFETDDRGGENRPQRAGGRRHPVLEQPAPPGLSFPQASASNGSSSFSVASLRSSSPTSSVSIMPSSRPS